jgi:hypothetical protein
MTDHDKRDSSVHLRYATHIHRSRRRRRILFAEHKEIFGEPAWDILLRLFIAFERGERVSLSDLAWSTDLPMTTTQRWARQLCDGGLLVEGSDWLDCRRKLISLSDDGVDKMRRYLEKHYLGPVQGRSAVFLS